MGEDLKTVVEGLKRSTTRLHQSLGEPHQLPRRHISSRFQGSSDNNIYMTLHAARPAIDAATEDKLAPMPTLDAIPGSILRSLAT